jgi:hypothetical protein
MKKTRLFTVALLAVVSIVLLGSCGNNNGPKLKNQVIVHGNSSMPIKKVYAIYDASGDINGYEHSILLTTINLDSIVNEVMKNPLAAASITIPAPGVLINVDVKCSAPSAFDYTDYTLNLDRIGGFEAEYTYITKPMSLTSFLEGVNNIIEEEDITSGTFSIKDHNGTPEIDLRGNSRLGNVEFNYKGQLADGNAMIALLEKIMGGIGDIIP